MELKNPIEEARRYRDNAKELLKEKAEKEDGYYQDSKYVKMAGHTMWTGCLVALDYALGIKKKRGARKDIDDYKSAAAKIDKKLLNYVVSGYNYMHLFMGYDGDKDVNTSLTGLKYMNLIIDWCETRTVKKE